MYKRQSGWQPPGQQWGGGVPPQWGKEWGGGQQAAGGEQEGSNMDATQKQLWDEHARREEEERQRLKDESEVDGEGGGGFDPAAMISSLFGGGKATNLLAQPSRPVGSADEARPDGSKAAAAPGSYAWRRISA